MKVRMLGMAGVCVLAVCVAATAMPRRSKVTRCADPAEVTAMQTTAIQQELMDAALTCGDAARVNYNAFQTRFSRDLQVSDKLMLKMFGRIMGGAKGDKAYNLFKTELAAKAELRRTHNHDDFCQEANLVAAAALGPTRIQLADFVADMPVAELSSGVNSCALEVGATLRGAMAGPNVVPTPNPLRVAAANASGANTPAAPAPR
jgi:hypothetical protein